MDDPKTPPPLSGALEQPSPPSPRAPRPLNRLLPNRIHVFSFALKDPLRLFLSPSTLSSYHSCCRCPEFPVGDKGRRCQSSRDRAELRAGLGGTAAQTGAPPGAGFGKPRPVQRRMRAPRAAPPSGGPRTLERSHSLVCSVATFSRNECRQMVGVTKCPSALFCFTLDHLRLVSTLQTDCSPDDCSPRCVRPLSTAALPSLRASPGRPVVFSIAVDLIYM